jgi:hypothetical protein
VTDGASLYAVSCSSGSRPVTGATPYFTYTEADLLSAFGNFSGWLTTWAMGLPNTPQVTSAFCASPPPAEMPTTADWIALAVPPAAILSGAYRRLGNWVVANKWASLCECVDTSGSGPCGDSAILHGVIDPHPNGFSQIGPALAVPPGTTQLSLSITVHCANTTSQTGLLAIRCLNASGGRIADVDHALLASTPLGWSLNLTSTTAYVNVTATDPTVSTLPPGTVAVQPAVSTPGLNRGDLTADSVWHYRCSSSGTPVAPPTPVPPPIGFPEPPGGGTCITIPDLCALIHEINLKIDLLWGAAPPPRHSYAEGFRHAGLSGDGQLQLSADAIAYRVTITTDNPGLGQLAGTPPYLLNRGFIVALTPEGAERLTVRLTYTTQLLELPFSATGLGYHFGPGLVVDVVELLRGP